MIASIAGKLEMVGVDSAIINVGGIGFQVFIPPASLAKLGDTGTSVKLYTHFQVRDDGVSLYGFISSSELSLFKNLLSVSGLGPKLALTMISEMDIETLAAAIVSGNIDLLTAIRGIGKKTASRIVLELKDKLATGEILLPLSEITQENNDVVAALISLGYSTSEATRAVSSLPTDKNLNLEDKIKMALTRLGRD
ncbi:MAG: Holliday junction branch migration protein RuvA [Dehalococcoidales bacterium]|jgi:Holliday junction DNA helicase RuvA|nr:Holliday junction branch migration protein RuvA [Dehalococcoidales bacterium]MDD3264721.1 Holliday junction branch migration protein RuvA [Dehalococcoidales bacterium]MDD4322681.1 Holliday junction branch migration protein RuvA [Dehalococcoidales bacterium]MDD4794301.1 Holliday junction branch migration protein RuvA [Dehalococcoidales bacterium]MDD5122106.1 Holliday junction branch migration protein RuvA [Dehalococcoidales bacterium]